MKGPTWKPSQEPPRASWSPDKPIWPQDGSTKLAGGGVGVVPCEGPARAVVRFLRLVFQGLWKISREIRGLAEKFWASRQAFCLASQDIEKPSNRVWFSITMPAARRLRKDRTELARW